MIEPNYATYRKQLKTLKPDMSELDIYQGYMEVVEGGWSIQTRPKKGYDGKYHFVYITERDDGKIYIGKHSTEDLDDQYHGSGYDIVDGMTSGRKFTTTQLEFFKTGEMAYETENKLVNSSFLSSPDVLNHVVGGKSNRHIPSVPPVKNDFDNGRARGWSFSDLHIGPGSTLSFIEDDSMTCKVLDDWMVEYDNHPMKLWRAGKLMCKGVEKYKNPLNAFKYNGKPLSQIRDELKVNAV